MVGSRGVIHQSVINQSLALVDVGVQSRRVTVGLFMRRSNEAFWSVFVVRSRRRRVSARREVSARCDYRVQLIAVVNRRTRRRARRRGHVSFLIAVVAVVVVGAAAAVRRCPVLVINRCRRGARGAHGVLSTSGYDHLVCRRSSFSAVSIRIARS
jgi:hypothetical protein